MADLSSAGGPKKPAKKWYTNVYILLIILVSLLAVSMAALLLLLLPRSSEIIRLMQWRMVNAKSFYVDASAEYHGELQSKDDSGIVRKRDEDLTFDTVGWVDLKDPALKRMAQKFDLRAGKGETALVFAGDYLRAGTANYFNFSTMPARLGTLHFDEFQGKWLRINVKKLLSFLDLPLIGGDHPELSDEDKAYLTEQFRQTPFLQVEEKLQSEPIGGVRTYHYKVRPEKLFFKDFYVMAESKRLGRELTNKERLAAETFFANLTEDSGEMWIGMGDYYLYRMRLRFKYDDGKRAGYVSLTANFSQFNEIPVIEAPTSGVQDATQVVASMLPGFKEHLPLAKEGQVPWGTAAEEEGIGGLPIKVNDSGQDDPDQDGLPNVLEKFYGSDPNNPDTDGDGVKDGEEVNRGDNPTGAGKLFDFFGGRFQ
jgi:hypothetical protein